MVPDEHRGEETQDLSVSKCPNFPFLTFNGICIHFLTGFIYGSFFTNLLTTFFPLLSHVGGFSPVCDDFIRFNSVIIKVTSNLRKNNEVSF